MTLACYGTGITRQTALGQAHMLQRTEIEIGPNFITQEESVTEVDRFRQALVQARKSLKKIRDQIPDSARVDLASFIDAHLLMLDDAALSKVPIRLIRDRLYTAEWAVQVQRDALVQLFDEMDDPYLRTRKDDVDHVVREIQKNLLDQEESKSIDLKGKIILAHDLTPTEIVLLHHLEIAAFVTDHGSSMSHTAILARSLGIPGVVGTRSATKCLALGEELIVNSKHGSVIAEADHVIYDHYKQQLQKHKEWAIQLEHLIDQPALTRDGREVDLQANIELPIEIITALKMGAKGIGLYRTEFLYMEQHLPDEEEHLSNYRTLIHGLGGLPLTIRTIDLGTDETTRSDTTTRNPALGLRAIRLCLKKPKLFVPQLRAILRVALEGPVRIMIPMLSSLSEIRQTKLLLEQTKAALRQEQVPFNPDVPLGGMIEVPAAAISADRFARELDFLSIGTNDLIQYTLVIDRVDDEVSYLYDPLHTSVLRLIQMTINAGKAANIPVGMCGEMAGDPRYTQLLLGMGLREFSMRPRSLLEVKKIIRESDLTWLTREVKKLMARTEHEDAAKVMEHICTY